MPPFTVAAADRVSPVAAAAAPLPSSLALTHYTAAPLWLLVSCSLVSASPSRTPRLLLPFILLALLFSALSFLYANDAPASTSASRLPFTAVRQASSPNVPVLPPITTTPPPTPTPSISATPAPSPSSSPSPPPPSPQPQPQQQPPPNNADNTPVQPSTSQVDPTSSTSAGSFSEQFSLDQCSGGLKRMQAVLLLELCFEFLFIFLRCFADREYIDDPPDSTDSPRNIDVTMRGYIFVRAIYTIPVLILNTSIYWIGGGPNGSCLSSYSALQVPFVHLIFYLLYCILHVIIGLYRIDAFEFKDSSISSSDMPHYRSSSSPRGGGGGGGGGGISAPPTRTSSSFQTYGHRRRHHHHNATESSGYELPKFRVNCGCCALNF